MLSSRQLVKSEPYKFFVDIVQHIIEIMVLELLTNPAEARHHLGKTLLLGFIYTSVALLLSMWIFHKSISLVSVFLTVIAAFPLFHDTIRGVAEEEYKHGRGKLLWREHSQALSVFFVLFLGVMLGFVAWYVFLPAPMLSDVFDTQTQIVIGVGGFSTAELAATSAALDPSDRMGFFAEILLNNLSVLSFCILFSFLYGAGAVFILIWNASVIGVALGNSIRLGMGRAAELFGLASQVVSLGVLRYSIHGIPEILAYLVAGLAGSMVSIGLYLSRKNRPYIKELLADVLELTGIAIILLVISAWLEAFVSTAIF